MAFFFFSVTSWWYLGQGREPRPTGMQEGNKAVGWVMLPLPPSSLDQHLLKTTRQGHRELKEEGEEPGRGRGRDRGQSWEPKKVMLVGAPSQTCKNFEEAWEWELLLESPGESHSEWGYPDENSLYFILFLFLKKIYIFYLAVIGLSCNMQDLQSLLQHEGLFFEWQYVGSSSLTRDRTWASCMES